MPNLKPTQGCRPAGRGRLAGCLRLAAAAGLLLLPRLAADTVWLRSGSTLVNVTVKSLAADGVRFTAAPENTPDPLPLDKVMKIQFAVFPVVAKPGGIVLTNGSRLSGVLRGMTPQCQFRSGALGPLELPAREVAAVYYAAAQWRKAQPKPAQPLPLATDTMGNTFTGKVLWADAASAGIRTPDGLKRLGAANLGYVQYATFAPAQQLLLRNGDVLNGPRTFDGDKVTVDLGPARGTVPLAAVAEINW